MTFAEFEEEVVNLCLLHNLDPDDITNELLDDAYEGNISPEQVIKDLEKTQNG
jgi:hypothetical protein